jgi:carbonic anhydrase
MAQRHDTGFPTADYAIADDAMSIQNDEPAIMETLAAGVRATLAGAAPAPWTGPSPDAPRVGVIMAADAPISPEQLTGAAPGLLFSIRPVGGLMPPAAGEGLDRATGAALEFALNFLGLRDLILIGHGDCAFVRALMADATPAAGVLVRGDYLPSLTEMLTPAVTRALGANVDDALRAKICAQEIMRLSIENLMTYPWFVDRMLDGSLRLHGWYIDEGGRFEHLDPGTDEFVPD